MPGSIASPGVEGGEAEERGEEGAAGEDVLDGFGEEGVDGEEEGRDPGYIGRERAVGDAVEEPDAGDVGGEIEEVPAAEGLIEEEGEIGQRPGLFETPEIGPGGWVGEEGVVVKDEDARQREGVRQEREKKK